MPEKLLDDLTDQQIRVLVAYLQTDADASHEPSKRPDQGPWHVP
jgi:hypothetical protein